MVVLAEPRAPKCTATGRPGSTSLTNRRREPGSKAPNHECVLCRLVPQPTPPPHPPPPPKKKVAEELSVAAGRPVTLNSVADISRLLYEELRLQEQVGRLAVGGCRLTGGDRQAGRQRLSWA